MREKFFQKFDGDEITVEMFIEAAELFSQHYGIWGAEAVKMMGAFAKPGTRVRMSKHHLRAQCLPPGALTTYVRATVDGHLAGRVFACRWMYDEKVVCWVTQLVVHREYRERGLATGLLSELREEGDAVVGVLSSHAGACRAAARAFGDGIDAVELGFIREHAEGIIRVSPVVYVKDAKLRGRLLGEDDGEGTVSCADTKFFVDHAEPLQALAVVREDVGWPLGTLIEGHEFLLIVEARPRSRSRC